MVARNLMILLGDDLKKNAEVEAGLKARGYSIIRAENRAEAVKKLKLKSLDLLICDTAHVQGDFSDIASALKGDGQREIPVILVSMMSADAEKQLFKTFPGVRAMVSRPIDMQQLEKLVATNLPEDAPIPGLEPDDDSDKPLYDRRDNVSIDIGAQVRIAGGAMVPAALVEYEEGSVLLDIGSHEAKKGDQVEVVIRSQGAGSPSTVQFTGSVISVEDVEGGGRLLNVDAKAVSQELSKNIIGQVVRRQTELLKFIRDTQE